MENKNKRFLSLDILKFICAILIMMHHYQASTKQINLIDLTNASKFSAGKLVSLFFMISGFLAAIKVEKTKNQSFGVYIKNKVIRFYPMTTISTFVCICISILFVFLYRYWYEGIELGIWRVICSFLLIYSGGSIKIGLCFNNQLWFVSVLLICYIAYYLLCKISKKLNIDFIYLSIFMVLLGIGIIDYSISLPFVNEAIASGYINFFMGAIIYDLYIYIYSKSHKYKKTILVISIVLLCLLFFIYTIDDGLLFDNNNYVFSFLIFPLILIFFVLINEYIRNERIKYLGNISFEIYLWHNASIVLLHCLEYFMPSIFDGQYNLVFGIFFIIYNILISSLFYFFVERKISLFFMRRNDNE